MRYPVTKHIFTQWNALRGLRMMPERSQISPANFGGDIRSVFLLARDELGAFNFRIAGTQICDVYGKELRGHSLLSLAAPAARDDLNEILNAVTDDAAPVIAGCSTLLPGHADIETEMLLLPLRFGERADVRILGAMVYRKGAPRLTEKAYAFDILSFRMIGENDIRHITPLPHVFAVAGHPAERRGHLAVIEGGQAQR